MQVLRIREQSELEEAVQEVITLASAQAPFPTKFASATTRSLIETLGGGGEDRAAHGNAPSSSRRQTNTLAVTNDLPTTTLIIQRRLNAEYRYLAAHMRDEHEDRIQTERSKAEKKEEELRAAHTAALKRIAAQQAAQQEVMLPHVKPPSATAVEVLERKLADQSAQHQFRDNAAERYASVFSSPNREPQEAAAPPIHSPGLDPVTRKVVTFWKAKYGTLLKQLEAVHADIAAAEAKCSQNVDLRGASADTLEQLLMTIRDAEDRERSRVDDLRTEYVDLCRRFGVAPNEPFVDGMGADVVYDPQTGRMVSKGELERHNGVESSAIEHNAAGNGSSEFFRTLSREQRVKNRERQRTIDQVEARIQKWYVDFDDALDAFALGAGKISTGGQTQLVEEVISLLSESDTLDQQCHDLELAQLNCEVELAQKARLEVEKFESLHLEALRGVEEAKDELRRLEIRLSCARQSRDHASHGDTLTAASALEDEAAVLTSKISLMENELVVYRTERRELDRVNATLDKKVSDVLQGQERQLLLQTTPRR